MLFEDIYNQAKPYTMTCRKRMEFLYNAVNNVVAKNIEGDCVEVGCWKGGNLLLMCLTLKELNENYRMVAGYDTFEDGMPEPGKFDVRYDGKKPDFSARDNLSNSYDEVHELLSNQDYKMWELVKGRVEKNQHGKRTHPIAILRSDTDFYDSTKWTLENFYPLLSEGGIYINDDYGHFKGAKKACDEHGLELRQIADTNAWWCYK